MLKIAATSPRATELMFGIHLYQILAEQMHPQFVCHSLVTLNTLRPRQNGRHFPDDIFKCIFLNENVLISIEISLKFVLEGQNNNIAALV